MSKIRASASWLAGEPIKSKKPNELYVLVETKSKLNAHAFDYLERMEEAEQANVSCQKTLALSVSNVIPSAKNQVRGLQTSGQVAPVSTFLAVVEKIQIFPVSHPVSVRRMS